MTSLYEAVIALDYLTTLVENMTVPQTREEAALQLFKFGPAVEAARAVTSKYDVDSLKQNM